MLIKCPECSHEISDEAIACPHCGYPIKAKANKKIDISKDESSLVKIAHRGGSSGYQVFVYIIAGFLLLCAFAFSIPGFIMLANNESIVGAIILLMFGEVFGAIGTFTIIYLSVILGKNAHITKDLIYFDKANEEFIFITIDNKEIRLKKDASFFIRDNKRNIGELIMKENGKKKVMLGFCTDSEDLIKREISKYQNS